MCICQSLGCWQKVDSWGLAIWCQYHSFLWTKDWNYPSLGPIWSCHPPDYETCDPIGSLSALKASVEPWCQSLKIWSLRWWSIRLGLGLPYVMLHLNPTPGREASIEGFYTETNVPQSKSKDSSPPTPPHHYQARTMEFYMETSAPKPSSANLMCAK